MKQSIQKTKRYLSSILLVWSVLCIFIVCFFMNKEQASAASKYGCISYGRTNVYFRESPGGTPLTSGGTNILLNGGQELEILDTSNSSWYKVCLVYSGTTYTGYVSSQYITIYDDSSITSGSSSDAEFEAYLTNQGFPESYKPQLRALHELHPNWIFNAVQTGLDWKTVVANEVNRSGAVKNLVQGTSGSPNYNWRSTTVGYNITSNTWSSYDASTWFAASDELVTYYLDPRVYLYEEFVFAFEQLTYNSSQTAAGVESILSGSFMANAKPSGSSSTYAELMIQAGKESGVSPYHIASRIRQEVGTTLSTVTNGKHSTYPGIYNFYNIGGSDSSSGDAPTKALAWAATGTSYGRPWNTVYKSIYGGALYIGGSYILKGQNTLYTQKFNVTNNENLYYHQYQSNVQAVSSEASNIYKSYKNSNSLDNTIVFSIPVYSNMPDTITSKPSASGNPNNYLSSLTVSGYTLTPSFRVGTTTAYSLIVPESVSSVSISAKAAYSKATISGTGTVSLSNGTNKVNIVVTAESGTKRTYTLTIVRGASTGTTTENPAFSGSYKVSSNIISGVATSTTVSSFISKLGCTNGTVTITDASGNTKSSGNIGTGDKVKVSVSGTITTYTVIIYGDVNGDGQITALDLLKLQKHLMGASKLSDAYLIAANVKRSGDVSALDLLRVQKHLMGASTISQ